LAEAGLDPGLSDALPRFLEIYDRRLLETTRPYNGMRETLTLLADRARLAVLTNKPQAPSERVLSGLGLRDFFDSVTGGDGPSGRKPDPAALRALVESAPDGGVLVGDSPVDWQTARNAGCPFVWARYGFGSARFESDYPETPYVLSAPNDLVEIVDRMTAVMRGA
jgi:phosphoglycolate phosphatase